MPERSGYERENAADPTVPNIGVLLPPMPRESTETLLPFTLGSADPPTPGGQLFLPV